MVTVRLASLFLGFLFTTLVLRDSTPHTHQAMGTMMVEESKRNEAYFETEFFNTVPAAATAENRRFGGRKMVVDHIQKKEGGFNGVTSKISGKYNNAMKKSLDTFQDNQNNQNIDSKFEPKKLNSTGTETSNTQAVDLPNTNQHNSKDSKATSRSWSMECTSKSKRPVSQEYPVEKIESENLLEDAAKVVSLMHKDYKGRGGPRRKPPINNHEPLD